MLVARDLLGKVLCVRRGRKIFKGIIIETEAYRGEDDLACHASRGRTKRTETLYQKPGTVYVYLIYGMYYCLNIVTEKKDFPAAVLVRGVIPLTNEHEDKINGPGRVCRYFGIDKRLNGLNITTGQDIWIEDKGIKVRRKDVIKSKRIGVDYAGRCKDYLWRFNVNIKG